MIRDPDPFQTLHKWFWSTTTDLYIEGGEGFILIGLFLNLASLGLKYSFPYIGVLSPKN